MNFALLTIILAIVWASITGNFTALNLILGALISIAALLIVRNQMTTPVLALRIKRSVQLAVLFLYELCLSAFRVAALVAAPDMKSRLRPGIIAFPLTAKSDVEITLLANLITLTPGTLSVDVASDRSVIYVHALTVDDKHALIKDIAQGFETKIMEVFE